MRVSITDGGNFYDIRMIYPATNVIRVLYPDGAEESLDVPYVKAESGAGDVRREPTLDDLKAVVRRHAAYSEGLRRSPARSRRMRMSAFIR